MHFLCIKEGGGGKKNPKPKPCSKSWGKWHPCAAEVGGLGTAPGWWVALGEPPARLGDVPPSRPPPRGGFFPPLSSFTEESEVSFDPLGPSRAGLFSSFLLRGFCWGGGEGSRPLCLPPPEAPVAFVLPRRSQRPFPRETEGSGGFGEGGVGLGEASGSLCTLAKEKDDLSTLSNYF